MKRPERVRGKASGAAGPRLFASRLPIALLCAVCVIVGVAAASAVFLVVGNGEPTGKVAMKKPGAPVGAQHAAGPTRATFARVRAGMGQAQAEAVMGPDWLPVQEARIVSIEQGWRMAQEDALMSKEAFWARGGTMQWVDHRTGEAFAVVVAGGVITAKQ